MTTPDSYVSNLYPETRPALATSLQNSSSARSLNKRVLAALAADVATCVVVTYISILGWSYVAGVHASFLQKPLFVLLVFLIFVVLLYRSRITGSHRSFHPLDETAQAVKVSAQAMFLTVFGTLVMHGLPWQAFAVAIVVMPIALTAQRHASRCVISKFKGARGASKISNTETREFSCELFLNGRKRPQNRGSVAAASKWYSAGKRAIDVCVSSILLIVLSPILLLIAALVRLTSSGPAFFSQERVGLRGQVFKIYKFRSMAWESFPYEISPAKASDPRITAIGRFLRKTGFDELPQLINILLGEMSLVGPRPEMPFIVGRYSGLQRRRLQVLPGLTGVWQLSADRAYPIHENLHHDLFYIERRTLALDMAILIHTLVFAMRGGI